MADGAAPYWLLAQTGTPVAAPAAPGATGGAPDPNAPQANPLGSLVMPLLLLGVFFLIFAPQMKRNKLHQKLLTELKPGDEVMTSGGFFGTITQVKADRFVVEIAKGVRVEVNRSNVEVRAPGAEPVAKPADEKKI